MNEPAPIDIPALERLTDAQLRMLIAHAAGIHCQRGGALATQEVLERIAQRLPGAIRTKAA